MSTAVRMAAAGAICVDPAISTNHGGEHGGMTKRETNCPSICLPEEVATLAAVSTTRCSRTSGVHRRGSDHNRPCSVLCALPIHRGRAWLVKAIPSANNSADRQPDRGEFVGKGRAGSGGKRRFIPTIHRREGVCEGRVRVSGVEDLFGVEHREEDSASFCICGARFIASRHRETG